MILFIRPDQKRVQNWSGKKRESESLAEKRFFVYIRSVDDKICRNYGDDLFWERNFELKYEFIPGRMEEA